MTNAELISMVRSIAKHGADWRINEVLNRAADALEAADKRIAELEKRTKLPDRQEFLAKGSFIEEPLSRPKEGEWIDEQRGRWIYAKCNLCGKVQDVRSNYPNCGAKMRNVTDCHTLDER